MEKVISDADAQVASFISSQPADILDISVNEQHQNMYSLPKECEPYTVKDYDFRWVSKDPRMLDRSKYKGWVICNRVHSPWLPENLFAAHGGIEKYGSVLAFRRKAVSDVLRKKIQTQSIENIGKATKKDEKDKDGSPFYTAKLSPQEEKVDEGEGLVQGRDF